MKFNCLQYVIYRAQFTGNRVHIIVLRKHKHLITLFEQTGFNIHYERDITITFPDMMYTLTETAHDATHFHATVNNN